MSEEQNDTKLISEEEVFDSIKLEDDDFEKVEIQEGKPKKDLPTPDEVKQMSDKDVIEIDTKVSELYDEFNSFLKVKAKITNNVVVKETIPSGIDIFDAVLGGGFSVGTLAIIVGPPGCGKSMIVGKTLGAVQRKYKGQAMVAYLDSEEAVTTIRLANLGVKYPKIKPYQDVTVEKVFKFLEGLCLFREEKKLTDTPAIVVWDSIANTITQKAREVDDINKVIGLKARMLSILLPKYVAKMSQYKICLLAINQLRDMLTVGGFQPAKDLKFITSNKDMPGGQSLKFNAFSLAEMRINKILVQGKENNKFPFDGVMVSTKTVKNKLFPPNIPIDIIGNFKTGFSNFWTNYHFLSENGRLKSGAWNYLVNAPNIRFRTKDARLTYNTNNEFKRYFDAAIKETIQTEIVDKNNKIED